MRAILVVRLFDIADQIGYLGIGATLRKIGELREIAHGYMRKNIVGACRDMVFATYDNVGEAEHIAGQMMQVLANTALSTTTTAAIGYGDMYVDTDGEPWGLDVEYAINLTADGGYGEILLTDNAQRQAGHERK